MRKVGRKSFLERTADLFDLPPEALAGSPTVTVTGDGKVLIEGHRGLLEYGTDTVSVRCGAMIARICGSGLELLAVSRRELVVTGRITGLAFVR